MTRPDSCQIMALTSTYLFHTKNSQSGFLTDGSNDAVDALKEADEYTDGDKMSPSCSSARRREEAI